jgi:putative FmdB family regulatory protein
MAALHQYEYECDPCNLTFEESRTIAQRNTPAKCPSCGEPCKKIISRTNFNPIFQGSTRAANLADYYTRLSLEAQSEGFRSKNELDTAIGLAKERAKQMGTPDKTLIGPQKSAFVGDKFQPSKDEAVKGQELVAAKIRAAHTNNPTEVKKADAAFKEHEAYIKGKAAKKPQQFKPDNSREDLKKAIKKSQDIRGSALS